MNIFDKISHEFDIRIEPTLHALEDIGNKYPKLATPITIGLIVTFPIFALAALILDELNEN